MSPEKDKLLCERYPRIFAKRNASMKETCMCWGFEVGDGWYWLIDKLCAALQNHVDNCYPHPPQIVAEQVKEKFGGLRFYFSGGDEIHNGMIDFAEYLSYQICEECGSTKDVGRTNGWVSVLCRTCYNKRNSISTWTSNEEAEKKHAELEESLKKEREEAEKGSEDEPHDDCA